MVAMKLPWHKLGLPDGLCGTLQNLKSHYGRDWNSLSKYFLPTSRLASSVKCPSPGGAGCPRRIVEHTFHDIVAVCGNSPKVCEPVRLTRQDLIIYELNINKLLRDLNDLFRIHGMAPVQFMPLTWELGRYTGQDKKNVPVYVSLSANTDRLQKAAISLIAQREKPFFLLVPSRDLCAVHLINTAEKAGVYLIGLDELQKRQNTANEGGLLEYHVCSGQPSIEEENIFRLEKDNWRVIFRGHAYTIKQSIGMQYITHLLQRSCNDQPEIHVLDLFYLVHKMPAVQEKHLSKMSSEQLAELGLDVSGLGKGLDLLTQEGKQWLAIQYKELETRMEEAEETGNNIETLELQEIKKALDEHIKKVFGFAGRTRTASDPNERARKSVSKSIGNTLDRLGRPKGDELAVYLDDHVTTGLFCSFRKDPNIPWKIMRN